MQGPPAFGRHSEQDDLFEELAGKRKSGFFQSLPWILLILVIGVAAGLLFYSNKELVATRSSLEETRAQLAAVRDSVDKAQRSAAESEANLARTKATMTGEKEHLEQQLQQATAKAKEADQLQAKLEKVVGKDEGEVSRDKDRLTLNLVDKLLFRSGEADLTRRGKRVLAKVVKILKEAPDKQVWVQGHTDRIPIKNSRFPSNWELSTTRAVNVVHYLQNAGIDPHRLAAVGFGQYHPISRRHPARNRRIEIVLFPRKVKLVRK